MNPNSTGSFGGSIGGSESIKAALARRGLGQAGATSQVSPGAATFDPATQGQGIQGQAPQTPPMGGTVPSAPMPQGAPTTPQAPAPMTPMGTPTTGGGESDLIIKALAERLKSNSKIQEATVMPPQGLV